MAATLEYMIAEVLELAGSAAEQNKKKRIIPRHIFLAVKNDDDLAHVTKAVTFPDSGVLPKIHNFLMPTMRPFVKKK